MGMVFWSPFSASDLSLPERQNGHIVGTDRPKEDERGRNRTKRPKPKCPGSVKETRHSERFRNAWI